MSKANLRYIFIVVFFLLTIYYLFVKAELYESRTAIIVRDLASPSTPEGFGLALLGAGPSSGLQDSMVVQEYLLSLDVFTLLNKQFHIINHFKSDKLDPIERLSSDATMEEILEFYRSRLLIEYDITSGILHVAYAHTDPKKAKEILEFLITQVEKQLNNFNNKRAKKQLLFVESQYQKKKEVMQRSSALFEEYQNKNLMLDPNSKVASSSAIIASLEASLTQKKIELSTLKGYLSDDNYEIKKIKSEIASIERSIIEKKEGLSGNDKERLNKLLFEYEKLKMTLEFDTEVYKNTLIQLESTKLDVVKEAKTLSIVTIPNLPDGYTYPNKPKAFITILVIMLLSYAIASMMAAIVRDHKE